MTDLSSLGPAAAAVIIVLLFLRYITGKESTQEKRDAIFARSMDNVAHSMKQVAVETRKAAKEAKERNGHLAELAVENNRNNLEQNKQIMKSISDISSQHVDKQIVTHQEVKGE